MCCTVAHSALSLLRRRGQWGVCPCGSGRRKVLLCDLCALLLAAAGLAVDALDFVLVVVFLLALVLGGWDPHATRAVALHWGVLVGKIDGLAGVVAVLAALGKSAGAGAELAGNGGVLLDPVGERILAVLNDAEKC